jgi:hypothetical protein
MLSLFDKSISVQLQQSFIKELPENFYKNHRPANHLHIRQAQLDKRPVIKIFK